MGTNIRSNFNAQFFTSDKLSELEAVILAIEESYASMIPLFFNEEMMTTDISQHTTISGLRNPEAKPENVPLTFQTLKSGYTKTYTATTYATGYRISKEMVKDGKFGFIERATKSFAKGMFELKEIQAADVFDGGFTNTGYDGQALFSTSHPLENGAGVTGSNTPSAGSELSITSYRELRNILQDTLNENGQRIKIMGKWFIVPQELQDVAEEIVKSTYNPEDANNAINTAYNKLELLPGGCWMYLDDPDAWYIAGDKTDNWLMFMNRQGMETDSDYDKRAFAWELMCNERWDFGYSNWRGIVGNPGAS